MSALTDILSAVAPTIATALGGPFAGAAVAFLSSKLGVPVEQVQQTVAGMGPADLVKLKEMDYEFQTKMAEIGIKIDLAQIAVNTEEAKSTNWFVAGGRPFIMWVCGVAFAYAAIIEPIARFVATVGYHYTGAFPAIDTNLTMQVLFGLLGLGALRSYDKKRGTAS
jgi:hypothetical protein